MPAPIIRWEVAATTGWLFRGTDIAMIRMFRQYRDDRRVPREEIAKIAGAISKRAPRLASRGHNDYRNDGSEIEAVVNQDGHVMRREFFDANEHA